MKSLNNIFEFMSGDTFTYSLSTIFSGNITCSLVGPTKIELHTRFDEIAGYVIEATAEETAIWTPGLYMLVCQLEVDDIKEVIHSGFVTIKPNLLTLTTPIDVRTHAKRVLDAIESVLENRATTDQESMTINGRTLVRTSIQDLLKLRLQYKREYEREQQILLPAHDRKVRVRL